MIVLVAADRAECPALRERLVAADLAILTPSDLSSGGWWFDPDRPQEARAVVDGRAVEAVDIDGVITVLPAVTSLDVDHIAESDREYVAAEMTAFLVAWLSDLPCRVLNRPTAQSLCGPAWVPERWALVAQEHGIPVWPLRRQYDPIQSAPAVAPSPDDTVCVTMVGDRCIGDDSRKLHRYVRDLAAVARVEMLSVAFAPWNGTLAVCGLSVTPDLANADTCDAVAAYFGVSRR